jgi:membrane peptidoglycan carboxypeptidase
MDLQTLWWRFFASALQIVAQNKAISGISLQLLVSVTLFGPLDVPRPVPGQRFETSFMRYRAAHNATSGEQRARWMPFESIPGQLICAVVKAEDRMFFRHRGFDWAGMYRSALRSIQGAQLIGGSSISQQLARNLYLSPERSWNRKIREALYTLRLEYTLTKRDLLELYLNAIEWGDGVWGADEAALAYFNVPARELGLEQALFLASRIASPRAPLEEEVLKRMGGVYQRVNWQLRASGFYDRARYRRAQQAWEAYRRALAGDEPAKALDAFSSTKEDLVSGEAAIAGECGLAMELANEER